MTTVDEEARNGLALITDLILPGTERLPAGTAVGAHLDLLDRALTADPRLIPAVLNFGKRASAAGKVSLEELRSWSEEDCEKVVFALTASYYMSPAVRKALGYPGQARRPIAEATPEEKQTEKLLAPVIARGPAFIAAPDAERERGRYA
jgi:hypothetical protein